jgi:hypothetical protein
MKYTDSSSLINVNTKLATNIMVTPNTKSRQNHYYKQGLGQRHHAKTPPRNGQRKTTPSPTSADCFKTPQNSGKAQISRCASEPIHRAKQQTRRSVTPTKPGQFLSSSPLTFAGPKCLEPPTPTSLPRPPTTWTKMEQPASCSARQALTFDDLVNHENNMNDMSQQLKMLLKVQA